MLIHELVFLESHLNIINHISSIKLHIMSFLYDVYYSKEFFQQFFKID